MSGTVIEGQKQLKDNWFLIFFHSDRSVFTKWNVILPFVFYGKIIQNS